MMTTPSATNTALAEELLSCFAGVPLAAHVCKDGKHDEDCPAFYRPAVALALQQKDDSAALEIDRLKEEIGRLRAACEWIGTPIPDDLLNSHSAETLRITIQVASAKARAALLTEGGKL